jgi:hypothetical protein
MGNDHVNPDYAKRRELIATISALSDQPKCPPRVIRASGVLLQYIINDLTEEDFPLAR